MARPRKRGLDYFPLDVNVFDDDKLFDVQSEYGPLGETVYLRLVCLVYKNGYYFKFESIDKLAAMVIRSIGSRWVESKREIADIINFLIECGLFSKRFAEMNILTSKGIQTRFKAATERRCSGIVEYSLIDGDKEFVNNVGVVETPKNVSVCDYAEKDVSRVENVPNVSRCDRSEKSFDVVGSFGVVDDVAEAGFMAWNIPDLEYSNTSRSNNCMQGLNDFSDTVESNITSHCNYDMNELNDLDFNDTIESNLSSHCNYDMNELNDLDFNNTVESNSSSHYDYDINELNDLYSYDMIENSVTNTAIKNDKNTKIVSVDNNSGFCYNNPTKKSKVNKSKVKESRANNRISDTGVEKCVPLSIEKIVNVFNSVCGSLPRVTKITEKRIRAVKSISDRINGDFEGLFKRVERSDFLSGRNGKWLNCCFDWIIQPSNLAKILNGNYDNFEYTSRRSGNFAYSNKYDNEVEYYEKLKMLSPCY